jgi:OOP family OmpA-OmpF porin
VPGTPDGRPSDSTPAAASRGFARRTGLVWLLALLIVPLVLTALLVGVKGDGLRSATADDRDGDAVQAPATSATPSGEPTSQPTEGPAVGPFSVERSGDAYSVTIAVPDQASKEAITAGIHELLPEGGTFNDQVSVDGATGRLDPAAFTALLRALSAGTEDTAIRYDGTTITLSGQVADQATKATAARAAAKAVPGAVIANQLKVPGAEKPPVSEACQTFEARLAELMSRQKIIFLSGTAIVNEATRGSVGKVAALLRTCPEARVEIAGHTDNLGDPATSMPLSQRRADAIKAALVRLGLPAERMISRGYGELQPLASNKTAAGRIANRRVEIRVP